MNDNNREIKFGRVHQSADDINLLRLSNSVKKLNKLFNADLKHIVNRVNVNKISLNVKIIEMMIFKSNPKEFEGNLEIRLCGVMILQKNAVTIKNFQPRNFHTRPLKSSSILKFQVKIYLDNILFVSKCVNNLTWSVFNTWFSFSSDQHKYEPEVLDKVPL